MLSLPVNQSDWALRLPPEFLMKSVRDKYGALINHSANGTMQSAIEYLNESIVSVTFDGISESTVEQSQPATDMVVESPAPVHAFRYASPGNPLNFVGNELTIGFRFSGNVLNYFMLFENWWLRHTRSESDNWDSVLVLEMYLGGACKETLVRVKMFDCIMDNLGSVSFGFDNTVLQSQTFEAKFYFNNIDIDIDTKTKN